MKRARERVVLYDVDGDCVVVIVAYDHAHVFHEIRESHQLSLLYQEACRVRVNARRAQREVLHDTKRQVKIPQNQQLLHNA